MLSNVTSFSLYHWLLVKYLVHYAGTAFINCTDQKHVDVFKWKHFPRYWPFVRGIHRSSVNSPHKVQWRGALIFSLICDLNKRLSKQKCGWWFKPRSHCADHSLSMFPIIADRPDLSWSWQNHQIVVITLDLCLSKTSCTILVQQLCDTGTTEVFEPLSCVRFRRPLVRPLIRSTRLHSWCWRPHIRSCRFATLKGPVPYIYGTHQCG